MVWLRHLLLIVTVAGCTGREAASGDDLAAAGSVLDDFHDAAARADEERYFGHFADDGVFLGTDASERWLPPAFRAYAHPHFAAGKAWSFEATRRALTILPEGTVAWFDEDLETMNLGPARGSGVLVKRDGAWRIQQYNLALTIPNARFDAVKEAAAVDAIAATKDDPLADLAWLAGTWLTEAPDGTRTVEQWSAPRGALMLGSGHAVRNDLTVGFEHMRIEGRKEGTVLVAQPGGGDGTELTRVSSENQTAVFENRAHDWPKRITYMRLRMPDGLRVRVEGDPGARVDEQVYRPVVITRGQ